MLVPRIVFQTSPEPASDYIRQIFRHSSPNWRYEHFTDADILHYFRAFPSCDFPRLREVFCSLKRGEHKADLFRYYYLYLNGGIFVDYDAAPNVNLDLVVGDHTHVFVYPFDQTAGIYNGIIAAPPRSSLILETLKHAYYTPPEILDNCYHFFCKTLKTLIAIHNPPNSVFYQEVNMVSKGLGGSIVLGSDGRILFTHYWNLGYVPYKMSNSDNNDEIQGLLVQSGTASVPLKLLIKQKFPKLVSASRRVKTLLRTGPNKDYSEKFSEVYSRNSWNQGSGVGSTIENTSEYNQIIIDFINRTGINQVTDIGCGDWQSTHLIYDALPQVDYLGIDCVESVIQANKCSHPLYSFRCFDAVSDTSQVRNSEVYILKDVLQHLRTRDIYRILDALTSKQYRYILITNYSGQSCDDEDLPDRNNVVHSRGLNSELLPLKKYNPVRLSNYYGAEDKEISVIFNRTSWNHCYPGQTWAFSTQLLKLTDVSKPLQRVGPNSDGGYVICSGINYDLFISCGIANDIRFEEAFLDLYPELACLAFDGTIQSFPVTHKNIKWIARNIAPYPSSNQSDLSDVLDGISDAFLKMDIEGAEFDWINNIGEDMLERIAQIVIEIHWPFDIYRARALKKLSETHSLIHIHGNNYNDCVIPSYLPSGRSKDGCIDVTGIDGKNLRFPEVYEATYLRKDLLPAGSRVIHKSFPTSLDFPNCQTIPDISFRV